MHVVGGGRSVEGGNSVIEDRSQGGGREGGREGGRVG